MLSYRQLSPFGVELDRDLAEPLSPAQADQFRKLFNTHGLILARGQALSMARQREVCGLLGPILDRPGEDGFMSNEGGGPSASALIWHSDAAYTEHPFDALSLHAVEVVDEAAEDMLPEQLAGAYVHRAGVELTCVHRSHAGEPEAGARFESRAVALEDVVGPFDDRRDPAHTAF